MRPKRIGTSSGSRPSFDAVSTSIGSRLPLGGFHPPWDSRDTASRSAFPCARRSSGERTTALLLVTASGRLSSSLLLFISAFLHWHQG
jgi:hypothetical protein